MTWDLESRSSSTDYWGKVTKSFLGEPSAEYQKKAGGRAGKQWHIEIEPLAPFQYHDHGTKTMSANMPPPGRAPADGSPLVMRMEEYQKHGFKFRSVEDFAALEGHIFYFKEESRPWKVGRNSGDTVDAWPVAMNDEFTPPDDVYVYPPRDENAAGGTVSDDNRNPFEVAAIMLVGKQVTPGYEVAIIIGSGDPLLSNHLEIMTATQRGKLTDLLVEKGLIEVVNGVVQQAGAPSGEAVPAKAKG